jgi:hypothetical protein
MVHMLELMQAEVDRFREMLAGAGAKLKPREKPVKALKTARPSGWPADPEERAAEALRRAAKAKANREAASAQSRAKRKASWDAQPAKVRKQRLAAMLAGRKAKKVQAVKLEAAA